MSEKKKFTVYVGSVVLCVGVAVLLHYVSFTNPYLQSICHLLRPFIYIGLYLVWAISFLYSYAVTPYGQSLSGILYTAAGEL